jgi:hypothetical protein
MRYIATILVLFALVGCSEESNPTGTPSLRSEFEVSNEATSPLSIVFESHGEWITVGVGETVQLGSIYASIGRFQTPSEVYDCISVRDAFIGRLLNQQSPVDDGVWTEISDGERVMIYRLVILDSDLTPTGVPDLCGQ